VELLSQIISLSSFHTSLFNINNNLPAVLTAVRNLLLVVKNGAVHGSNNSAALFNSAFCHNTLEVQRHPRKTSVSCSAVVEAAGALFHFFSAYGAIHIYQSFYNLLLSPYESSSFAAVREALSCRASLFFGLPPKNSLSRALLRQRSAKNKSKLLFPSFASQNVGAGKYFALCGERFRGFAPKNPTKGCEAPFGNPLFFSVVATPMFHEVKLGTKRLRLVYNASAALSFCVNSFSTSALSAGNLVKSGLSSISAFAAC